MRPAFHLSVLAIFLILMGCQQAPPPVFKFIPEGKNMDAVSRFEVVDDFNRQQEPTRFRSRWDVVEKAGAEIEVGWSREDAIYHGGALSLKYNLPPNSQGQLSTQFEESDLSQTEYITLLVHEPEWKSFGANLLVELRDAFNNSEKVSVHAHVGKKIRGWRQISIPKSAYTKVDFDALVGLSLDLEALDAARSGSIILDEIAFFGEENLIFESARDNLIGFPSKGEAKGRVEALLRITDDAAFIKEIAADTWKYFEDLIDKETLLPVDHVRLGRTFGIGNYTSPTNVAMYWISCIGAADLGLITKEEAIRHIDESLSSWRKLEHWEHEFSYNYYRTQTRTITRRFISTVDNAWFAAGLVLIRQAFPETFQEKASQILDEMDFSVLYDSGLGQLTIGYDVETDTPSPYHYGLLASEARLASYIAIGKGDLEKKHWAEIYRTLPEAWDWQTQQPKGEQKVLFGVPVFQGYYEYLDRKFIPSWGGSLFEFLAPALIVDEMKYGPKSFGKNNEAATDLHILYAIREKKYPVWGIAPSAIENGRKWMYVEYGVPKLGAKGYPDKGVITPYASFIALNVRSKNVLKNLRTMLERYPDIYGPYGFYDTVIVKSGIVNEQYLLIDQAMSFMAMINYLTDGSLQKLFHSDPIAAASEEILKSESFFD